MANSKVVIEVTSTAKGLKMTTKQVDDQTKAVDKLSGSQEKLGKRTDSTNKKEKALYQTNLSSAKGFSKMNQTIGGSSGSGALVGSYAILAANVFALTAAFNTLRRAAAVDKLTEGLQSFSNTTGMSLDIVSKRLQETTGYAVSFEQAMRTAALSVSAGFGTTEMEGLTRVAKGASLALGRDMGDALDRLTRGAIKLEPEILDELGIMVRLDEATENYAASIGKTASTLTRFERQQAFMNAIISEGEAKFGAIADSIDPNAYDNLAAAFADLSKNFLSLLNMALIPTINFLLRHQGIFVGLVTMFAGSIIKRMLPALGDMTAASRQAAAAALESIQAAVDAGAKSSQEQLKNLRVMKDMPKSYLNIVGAIKQGTASTKEMTIAQGQLTRQMNKMEKDAGGLDKLTKAQKKYHTQLRMTRDALIEIKKGNEGIAAGRALREAEARLHFAEAEADILEEVNRKTFTLKGTYEKYKNVVKGIGKATKQYWIELVMAAGITKKSTMWDKLKTFTLATLKTAFKGAALSAKAFGIALLNAIPIIGQVITVVMFLIDGLKWVAKQFGFFSEESKAAKEAAKDLETVLDDIPNKLKSIEDATKRATFSNTPLIDSLRTLGGMYKTVYEEAIRAQQARVAAGQNFDPDMQVSRLSDSGLSRNQLVKATKELYDQDKNFADFVRSELGMSLEQWMENNRKTGKTIRELEEDMHNLLAGAEKAFDGIAQEADGMKRNIQEMDKELGKFLKKKGTKSEYDGILQQFNAVNNSIEAVWLQVAQGTYSMNKANKIFAETAQSLTRNMALIMGPEVRDAYLAQVEVENEIIELNKELARTTNAEKRAELQEKINKKSERYKELTQDTAEAMKQNGEMAQNWLETTRTLEKLYKEQNKDLKQQIKLIKQIGKDGNINAATALLTNRIAENTINVLRHQLRDMTEVYNDARKRLAKDPKDTDARRLLDEEKETKREIATLEDQITHQNVVQAEIALAHVKLADELLKKEKQLLELKLEATELDDQQFRRLRGQVEGPAEIAIREIDAAKQRVVFAEQEKNTRILMLQMEFDLLKAKKLQWEIENAGTVADLRAKKSAADALREEIKLLEEAEKQINDDFLTFSADRSQAPERMGYRLGSIGGGSAGDERDLSNRLWRLRMDLIDMENDVGAGLLDTYDEVDRLLNKSLETSNLLMERGKEIVEKEYQNMLKNFDKTLFEQLGNIGNIFEQAGGGTALANVMSKIFTDGTVGKQMVTALKKSGEADFGIKGLTGEAENDKGILAAFDTSSMSEEQLENFQAWKEKYIETVDAALSKNMELAASFSALAQTIRSSFGEDGALAASIADFSAFTISTFETFDKFEEGAITTADKFQVAADAIGGISQIMAAHSSGQIREIDKQIAAEKKRDGKSRESIAKIKEMEKKKEQMQRKAFEMNKKMMMAQTIANTAAGMMKTVGETGFFGIPLAAIVAAMGAAQLAIISKQKFEGSSGSIEEPKRQALNIGKAANRIDVSRGAQAGEIGYLRGQRGMPGGAAGMKRYADGGPIVVGERGPEVIQPTTEGYNVIPNDQVGIGGNNVNFTINAVDATGVEQLLVEQRGNIIEMIRDAANNTGERFLEDVDTQAMGSSGGGYGG